ncbi:solute carrier family 46 member 3-like [Mercenaria mercenaria]|uniref:solute carrier family 46 member 3-like n=1 Tax=Mercenaria mercenaria TaxID=6596 RepID=UPI00234F52C5|nr:solute carrier family 46 member 3-like [Mercenaria mercenaria]
MEERSPDQDLCFDEHTPLVVPFQNSQNEISSRQDSSSMHSTKGNNTTKGFTLKRSMVIPMSVCYCFACGIHMYIVPQYVQEVMKGSDEKELPHQIKPPKENLFQSPVNSTFNACSYVNKSDPSYEKFTRVQQDTARWLIDFNVALLLPAMFANLVWASFSDVFGRKFSLFLCLMSFTIRATVFMLVVYFKLRLVFVIIGIIIDGLAGSFTSFNAVLFSFVSDISNTGRQRTIAIVVIELVTGLTYTVSSLVSGNLIEKYGFLFPSMAVSCLSGIGVLILLFLVPETKPNIRIQRQGSSMLKSVTESVKFYFCDGSKIKRAKYILLMLGFFFMGIPALSRSTLEVLYQLGRPFCWTSTKIGWFGALKMAVASLLGLGGVYVFKGCIADDTITLYSLIFSTAAFIVEGLAKTDFALYSVTLIAAPSELPFPMIRSLMSCLTPAEKQGALFASIGFVETLCSLIGSVSNNAVYSATLKIMNGFVFLLMAGLTLIGAFFILAFMVVQRRFSDYPVEVSPVADTTHTLVNSINDIS